MWIAGKDETNVSGGVNCYLAHEVGTAAKAGYWLYKTWRWLKDQVPPEPIP